MEKMFYSCSYFQLNRRCTYQTLSFVICLCFACH